MSLHHSRYASIFGSETKRIGPFRFPVLKSLTVAERQTLEDLQRENAESGLSLYVLAERLRRDRDLSLDEAVDLLQQPNPEQNEILRDYAAELTVVLRNTGSASAVKARLVTAALVSRGQFQESIGHWEPTDDWTEALTSSLPEGLINQIHQFLLTEQNGGKPPQKAAQKAPEPAPAEKPRSGRSKPRSQRAGKSSQRPAPTGGDTTTESNSQE